MNDDDEGLDEEALIQRALMLSMAENQQKPAETPAATGEQPASTDNQFKDLLQNNDFLMDIAKDLGIEGLGDDEEESKKKEAEQKKKEEEDKK
jgi:hypothetical protein